MTRMPGEHVSHLTSHKPDLPDNPLSAHVIGSTAPPSPDQCAAALTVLRRHNATDLADMLGLTLEPR